MLCPRELSTECMNTFIEDMSAYAPYLATHLLHWSYHSSNIELDSLLYIMELERSEQWS